ncbi:MAG: hypothetical protein Q4P15_02195 [Propionibacteriaceae bacterium]|nr:hypothetical protein [Propionibacteriaceae bacterium]
MTNGKSVRLARGVQHLLPVVLLLVAFLELSALIPVSFDTLDVGGVAALLGPASFVPVSLAVVWSAFLPPTRTGQLVKVVTAAGATGFVGARLVLTILWWVAAADNGAPGWSTTVLGLAGLLLGIALVVWSVADVAATRTALVGRSVTGTPEPAPSPQKSAGMAQPAALRTPWTSVSTPWPRRDENDPEGTLIRPPRPQGQRR